MKIVSNNPEEYLSLVPIEKRESFIKLRETILQHIPEGFEECIIYDMIGYVVPKSMYPAGYHSQPQLPLPFLNIGIQKNFIGFYHFGLYADPLLLEWFQAEYPKHATSKLDMGKSCVRFKQQIPYELVGELIQKMSPSNWIVLYEKTIKR
jgi:hypothetical protein